MENISTNSVLSNFNNFPRLTKTIAATLGVFLFLGVISTHMKTLNLFAMNVVYIVPPRFYLWTFFTASLIETSIISGIFNIISVLFIGKYLEPIWGSKVFIKFILVVIFFPTLCAFFFFVFYFFFFGNVINLMKANVSGFSGVIAALSVALKQIATEQELDFILLKIKAKWIPSILVLFRIVLFSFIGFQDRSFTLVIFGVFTAWIYLRFYQAKPGTKGDPNESFSFYTFFPEPIQPPIKVVSNIIFKILCKLSICSSSAFSNQSILPITNNGNSSNNDENYSVADMERRRALAVKALEERMQQQNQHQQQQQNQHQHQQQNQHQNLNVSIDSQNPN
ncbi:hypothetical protein RB653_004844 [Dictyostelium firmibasis]|uniref:Transmembrane protein n=1 Tax=Dictyostelium firmibasis TaxID=79012 RepID=A0AAN7U6M1_9MYCE